MHKTALTKLAVEDGDFTTDPAINAQKIEETIRKAITAQNRRLPSFKQIHKVEFRDTEFEKTTSRKIKRHLVK